MTKRKRKWVSHKDQPSTEEELSQVTHRDKNIRLIALKRNLMINLNSMLMTSTKTQELPSIWSKKVFLKCLINPQVLITHQGMI